MVRHACVCLDVVEVGGESPRASARLREPRRPGPREPALPFDRGDEGGGLSAYKRPRAFPYVHRAVKTRAQYVLPKEAHLLGLLYGDSQIFDRKRVFVPDVYNAVFGPDGIGAKQHALQQAVRVAPHDRPVHEGTGVALVAVCDDELYPARGALGVFPLSARREARAAAAAKVGAT